jgi:hypothetical protein
MYSSPSDGEMGLPAHRVTFPAFTYEQLLRKLSLLTNNTVASLSLTNNILTLPSPAWKTRGGSGGSYYEVRRLGESEYGIATHLCVLSAKLRDGTGQRVILEEIALRDPVMPVPDGLIR